MITKNNKSAESQCKRVSFQFTFKHCQIIACLGNRSSDMQYMERIL